MNATIILIFLVLVCLHFIYESILAPTFRESLQYKLFALRDRLRLLNTTHPKLDKRIFIHLQTSINNQINALPYTDFYSIALVQNSLIKDKDLESKVKEAANLISNCNVKDINEIQTESLRIFATSICINNLIFLIPFAPIFFFYFFLKALIKKLISSIQESMYLSEADYYSISSRPVFARVSPVKRC